MSRTLTLSDVNFEMLSQKTYLPQPTSCDSCTSHLCSVMVLRNMNPAKEFRSLKTSTLNSSHTTPNHDKTKIYPFHFASNGLKSECSVPPGTTKPLRNEQRNILVETSSLLQLSGPRNQLNKHDSFSGTYWNTVLKEKLNKRTKMRKRFQK